jgi:hypothetical protein
MKINKKQLKKKKEEEQANKQFARLASATQLITQLSYAILTKKKSSEKSGVEGGMKWIGYLARARAKTRAMTRTSVHLPISLLSFFPSP